MAVERENQPSRTDAELAVGWQAGDPDAITEVYERYYEDLYGYVRFALRDQHEAEDLTQQIFLNAIEAGARFDPHGRASLKTWLFRIGRNAMVDKVRARQRTLPEDPERIRRREEVSDQEMETLLSWIKDAELGIFIERLPAAQREVLVLRYLLAMDRGETAEAMGRTRRAVYDLEQRALKTLQARLSAIGRRAVRRGRIPILTRIRPAPVMAARRFALWSGRGALGRRRPAGGRG